MPAPYATRKRRQSSPAPVNLLFFHSVGVVLDFAASELICCSSHYHRRPLLNWWRKAVRGVPKEMRKGLNYLIILIS
jgi:hypothetical protein